MTHKVLCYHHHRATNIYYLVLVQCLYRTQYIMVTHIPVLLHTTIVTLSSINVDCGWYGSWVPHVTSRSIVWHYMSDKTVLVLFRMELPYQVYYGTSIPGIGMLWNFHARYIMELPYQIYNISFRRKVLLLFFWLLKDSKRKEWRVFDWLSTFRIHTFRRFSRTEYWYTSTKRS